MEDNWREEFSKNDYQQFGPSAGVQPGGFNVEGAGGFTGQISMWPARDAPEGWLLCDGQAYPAEDYPNLFNVLAPLLGVFTCDSSTDIFTLQDHGLREGDRVLLESDDSLPAPLDTSVTYGYPVEVFVRDVTTDTFKVSVSRGGSAVAITDDGSGVHTLRFIPYGVAGVDILSVKQNDPLEFFTPFFKANMPLAYDASEDYNSFCLGEFNQAPVHSHSLAEADGATGYARISIASGGSLAQTHRSGKPDYTAERQLGSTGSASSTTRSSGADLAGNTAEHDSQGAPLSPYLVVNFIIKT